MKFQILGMRQKGVGMKQAWIFCIAFSLCVSCASTRFDDSEQRNLFHISFAEYLAGRGSESLAPDQYAVDFVDLNNDGIRDAIALVSLWETGFAGSGGGSLFIFAGTPDGAFQFMSKSSVTREPVFVRQITNRGWRDLVVRSAGGGIQPSARVMVFDGKSYPSNPSVEPRTSITQSDLLILGSSE
jgi:hypothetical protein